MKRASSLMVLLLAIMPFSMALQNDASDASAVPRFSLAISFSQDAIRGDEEMPLEVSMTNTSTQDYWIDTSFGPPLWTRLGGIEVRDESGKLLVQKESMKQFQGWNGGGPAIVLHSGRTMKIEVLLNRMYDLSRAGKYTVQAIRYDEKETVRSNILTIIVPKSSPARTGKPDFSVSLSTPYEAVKSGYQVPLSITVRNVSKKTLLLRSWEDSGRGGAGVSHEFASGITALDGTGKTVGWTKAGSDLVEERVFPAGQFKYVVLRPGETALETKLAGELYDLKRPDNYQFQVSLKDPSSGQIVRSNPVFVNVLAADNSAALKKQVPFVLDIRPCENAQESGFKTIAAIDLAITNRSDHPIDFDIGFGDNDVEVYESDGKLALLTEIGRKYRAPLPRGGPPTQHIAPHETAGGGTIQLDALYVMAHNKKYSVQVKAYDPETKSIVASNTITITAQ